MRIDEVVEPSWEFYFSMAFDPKIKQLILKNRFHPASLSCQDESYRWADKLKKLGVEDIEIHHGFYQSTTANEPEGHTWLEINGSIFDPTAAQFDDPGEGEYETHEID